MIRILPQNKIWFLLFLLYFFRFLFFLFLFFCFLLRVKIKKVGWRLSRLITQFKWSNRFLILYRSRTKRKSFIITQAKRTASKCRRLLPRIFRLLHFFRSLWGCRWSWRKRTWLSILVKIKSRWSLFLLFCFKLRFSLRLLTWLLDALILAIIDSFLLWLAQVEVKFGWTLTKHRHLGCFLFLFFWLLLSFLGTLGSSWRVQVEHWLLVLLRALRSQVESAWLSSCRFANVESEKVWGWLLVLLVRLLAWLAWEV